METNTHKEEQLSTIVKEGTLLKKMIDLGICAIRETEGDSFNIMLESPNVPLAKFFSAVSYIWPEIEIGYYDSGFPYSITIAAERDGSTELKRDFSDTSNLKFLYNPESLSINPDFIDSVLSEWFIFVQTRFLYISRNETDNYKIPKNWPHDVTFHRVSRSIKRAISDIFIKLDWETFNYTLTEYASIIIKVDLGNGVYFSDNLLDDISEKDLTIRHITEGIKMSRNKK